jgi:hypothetical protein
MSEDNTKIYGVYSLVNLEAGDFLEDQNGLIYVAIECSKQGELTRIRGPFSREPEWHEHLGAWGIPSPVTKVDVID